ncbi:hypothetical protein DPMN_152016 [Dreissena polymorpha]|uniref:Uncharacterized protein n=1 Tax=Dreissena polymorpha TaxID=45954 RepID=A0A9D4FHJ4_DREPO|nr:hypothetical protein DPMN_152016 [Dreissena polymorpha]
MAEYDECFLIYDMDSDVPFYGFDEVEFKILPVDPLVLEERLAASSAFQAAVLAELETEESVKAAGVPVPDGDLVLEADGDLVPETAGDLVPVAAGDLVPERLGIWFSGWGSGSGSGWGSGSGSGSVWFR